MLLKCTKCGKEKDSGCFAKHNRTRGFQSWCRGCKAEHHKLTWEYKPIAPTPMASYLICSKCGEEKKKKNFGKSKKRKKNPSGYYPRCKVCKAKDQKESNKKNHVKLRERRLSLYRQDPEKFRKRSLDSYRKKHPKKQRYVPKSGYLVCSNCGNEKNIANFNKDNSKQHLTGHSSQCKDCVSRLKKERYVPKTYRRERGKWRKENPDLVYQMALENQRIDRKFLPDYVMRAVLCRELKIKVADLYEFEDLSEIIKTRRGLLLGRRGDRILMEAINNLKKEAINEHFRHEV